MKTLNLIVACLFIIQGYSQECVTECENKPNVLVDRFSKEILGVKFCGVKPNNQFQLTFVRVEEVLSKESHFAFKFSHWDNTKEKDHKLSSAYLEEHELKSFIETVDYYINKNDFPKGLGSHSYSYVSHDGLKLYCYYSDTGWQNYLIFENYNDLRLKVCYENLVKLKEKLEQSKILIENQEYQQL
jgi:hypothetical protein